MENKKQQHQETDKPVHEEPPVIADECGDSLWDEVLAQHEQHGYQKVLAVLRFTPAVKAMQEKLGSRASYARMEQSTYQDGLTENEIEFIEQRDSFYMASFSESGYPYIQHRGGPKGFLQVLDRERIGFIDFSGNKQYITTGNLATNSKVALIMVDYPARTRLKLLAKASVIELKDDPALFEQLKPGNYKFKPERMMVLHVEAYDWNCPQHITPRYTAQDIETAFAAERKKVQEMQAELVELRAKLAEYEFVILPSWAGNKTMVRTKTN